MYRPWGSHMFYRSYINSFMEEILGWLCMKFSRDDCILKLKAEIQNSCWIETLLKIHKIFYCEITEKYSTYESFSVPFYKML